MEQKNIPEIDRNTAKSLFELARAASDKAYAPFSHYKVGAALLTKGGKVYTGVNIENSSFGATICAERTAFVKAISEGERNLRLLPFMDQAVKRFPAGSADSSCSSLHRRSSLSRRMIHSSCISDR